MEFQERDLLAQNIFEVSIDKYVHIYSGLGPERMSLISGWDLMFIYIYYINWLYLFVLINVIKD